jgi:hypothetical protein
MHQSKARAANLGRQVSRPLEEPVLARWEISRMTQYEQNEQNVGADLRVELRAPQTQRSRRNVEIVSMKSVIDATCGALRTKSSN